MVLIERASKSDFEHICALDETILGSGRRRPEIARAFTQGRVAVARVDGVVRGYVITDTSFFDNGYVRLLLVHPEYRRRGLATALMRAAELDCETDKLFTSTNQSNLAMQALCDRLGYQRSGIVENLDEGDPELIYVKRLTPGPRDLSSRGQDDDE
jgi:ribosomal protein S18 acetylase RimI-like enzyme